MIVARSARGVPPWSMAVAAMLAVQLSNALSVPVIGQVGAGGTAWLRMCFGVVFLWMIARPAIRDLRRQDIPALLALGVVTGFMTTFFLAAIERIPLGTAVAIEFLGPLTVAGLMNKHRKALVWPLLAFLGVLLLTEPWHADIDPAGVGFALAAGGVLGAVQRAYATRRRSIRRYQRPLAHDPHRRAGHTAGRATAGHRR